ncbi:hypothetical protein C5167_029040 [Papaver somniferum]|nr:hypothetical protein C5167_029040 [Papaver somniferum]
MCLNSIREILHCMRCRELGCLLRKDSKLQGWTRSFSSDNGDLVDVVVPFMGESITDGKQEDPCLHDDWVSAVSGSNPGFILTGCYDGFGRQLIISSIAKSNYMSAGQTSTVLYRFF